MRHSRAGRTAPATEALRSVGERAGRLQERYSDQVDTLREELPARLDTVRSHAQELAEALPERLEVARTRSADAWEALHGRPRPPRRWPWAGGAAVLGALAGVAGALLWSRLRTPEAPGAQDPDQVRAVVDLPPAAPAAAPGGLVDEDGEAVHPA